jgi:hypothetical protein
MTYPQDADLEIPEADAAEQATSALPGPAEDGDGDATDGDRLVELDDEYR